MEKKTKILIGCIIGFAFLCFIIAFIISNNKTYVVTFDSNGGTYVTNQKVKKGNYVSKPVDPIKEGYEFVEWRLDGKKYDFSSKVVSDITLKAYYEKSKNKYEVELEVDGVKKKVEVKEGETIDLSKVSFEEKEGFEIKWYLDDKEFDIEKEKIKEKMSLTGKYVEVKVYTVKFDSDGGSKIEDQKVNENKTVKEPNEPTKEGYVFENWYLNNQEYDFKEKVTSDITLKAKWIEDKNVKKYTVKFDSDGGSKINNQTVIENKRVNVPITPAKNGYRFVEWQLNGRKYDFNSKVTKDITLTAKWEKIANYTVKFKTDSNAPYNYAYKTVTSGDKVSNPGTPTKEGYEFTGWTLDGNAYDFNSPVTRDITIIASWKQTSGGNQNEEKPSDEPKTVNYTVKFDSNGGTEKYSDKTVVNGGKISNPGTPTRSNYTFNGWLFNGKVFDFNTPITSNITLVASWSEIPSYTVTFDSDGGTSYNSQTVQKGSKATNPGNPSKAGYTFGGWILGTSNFDFNTPINSNITLKAKWNEITYTIKAEKADTYSVDAVLKVYNGTTEITNYRCIALSNGECLDSNRVSIKFYNRESSFIVILNDGTQVKAIK